MRWMVVLPLLGFALDVRAADTSALFEPHATVDNDPVCASVVAHARTAFRSDNRSVTAAMPLTQVGKLTRIDSIEPEPGGEFEGSYGRGTQRFDLSTPDRPLFMFKVNVPGCGGGCETVQAFVSSSPDASERFTTGNYTDWDLYSAGGTRYLLGYDDDEVMLYRLSDPKLAPVCHVKLSTTREDLRSKPELSEATRIVDVYAATVVRLQGESGQCGSLNAPGRLRWQLSTSLDMLLYRPWAQNSGKVVPPELEAWSLQGIAEFEAYALQQKAFRQARDTLAKLYGANYRLSPPAALELAEGALSGATASGFTFPGAHYGEEALFPEGNDARLRRAILERRPMSEISAIDISAIALDGGRDGESVLNVAVRYPEALEWLLKRGANPNVSNAFGKTPLMYAAQFDDLRSVDLLLAAGAYVNATTKQPLDSCYYALSNDGFTALHYAARFAGLPLVRRLLAAGAFTFASTASPPVYPLYVLRKYESADRHEALTDEDRAAMAAALVQPDDVTRKTIGAERAALGLRLHRAGKSESAWQAMSDARLAGLPSRAAEADFALIALRAGRIIDSMRASKNLIDDAGDANLRAAGWFNLALACRQRGHAPLDPTYEYCREDEALLFLHSWSASPTRVRENAVTERLDSLTPDCTVDLPDGKQERYYVLWANPDPRNEGNSPQRVLVRHARGSPPPPDALVFTRGASRNGLEDVRASLVESHDLPNYSISILKGAGVIHGNVLVRGKTCHIGR